MTKKTKIIGLAVVIVVVLMAAAAIKNFVITQMYSATSDDQAYRPVSGNSVGFGLEYGETLNLGASDSASKRSYGESVSPQVPPKTGGADEISIDRLVIKTGDISMVVEDVSAAMREITKYVQAVDGFIVSSNLTDPVENAKGYMTVRVPAENFDTAVTAFKDLAVKISSERAEGQDVTEEYVDLQAQLKNLEATENQYLEIMKKAYKIEDILQVQDRLKQVRGEIERTQGRIKYLKESAAMSTININLALDEASLPIVSQDKWRPGVAARLAWRGVISALKGISYAVIKLAVYGIIWAPLGVIAWLVWRVVKRRRARQKASE